MFGYKNHIGIDKAHGLIRTWDASAANAHDGARLPDLISKGNTGSGVWADTAYRSKKNEAFLAAGMFKSHIHQKRKPRQPLPERIAKANTRRSKIRAHVEHVFAGQKHRMGLVVRTIGIARATIKIGMANLVYNFQRLAWLEGDAPACENMALNGAPDQKTKETGPKANPHVSKAAIRPLAPPSSQKQPVLRGVQLGLRRRSIAHGRSVASTSALGRRRFLWHYHPCRPAQRRNPLLVTHPIKVLFWSAVINGIVSMPIMVAPMVVVSRRSGMGQFTAPKASFSDKLQRPS
jgi:hypothetical protein